MLFYKWTYIGVVIDYKNATLLILIYSFLLLMAFDFQNLIFFWAIKCLFYKWTYIGVVINNNNATLLILIYSFLLLSWKFNIIHISLFKRSFHNAKTMNSLIYTPDSIWSYFLDFRLSVCFSWQYMSLHS